MTNMNKFVILSLGVVVAILAIALFTFFSRKAAAPENKHMTITSPGLRQNALIPKQFTCDGENINPELAIGAIPENAKGLALIMDDPDAPRGTFTHWLLWNISPNTFSIAENSVPAGALQGKNGAGKNSYIGPCPPLGKPHRYFFKLYALDALLNLSAGADKNSLESEINAHLLAKAEIILIYQR